jgi:hypothetical protein
MKIILFWGTVFCALSGMEKLDADIYSLVKHMQSKEGLDEFIEGKAQYHLLSDDIQSRIQSSLPGIDQLREVLIDETDVCSNILFFPFKQQFAAIVKTERSTGLRLMNSKGKKQYNMRFPQSMQKDFAAVPRYIIQGNDDEARILIQSGEPQENKIYFLNIDNKRIKKIEYLDDGDRAFIFGGQNIIQTQDDSVHLLDAYTATSIISSVGDMLWNEQGNHKLLLVEYPGLINDLYAVHGQEIVWIKKFFNVIKVCISSDGAWIATITYSRNKTGYQTDLFFIVGEEQSVLSKQTLPKPVVKKRWMLDEYNLVIGEMGFSFDSSFFVWCDAKFLRLYDVSSKKPVRVLDLPNQSFIFGFSFDSKYLWIKDFLGFSRYFIDIHSLIERRKKTQAVVMLDELLKDCSFVRRATDNILFVGTRWMGKYNQEAETYCLWDIITKNIILEEKDVTDEVIMDEDNFLLFIPQGGKNKIFSFANQLSINDYLAYRQLLERSDKNKPVHHNNVKDLLS